MCLQKQIREMEEKLSCLKEQVKEKFRPTKTVRYRMVQKIGSDAWWNIEEMKCGEWEKINDFCNVNGVCGAEQEFKEKYLNKRIIKEYTCEQWC